MLVFIDESGDAGFKIAKGSTNIFVVALIIFNDELDAEETALKIKKLRRTLRKRENFEFKFNKCSKEYRLKFLKTVKNDKFKIRAIVIQKEKIYSNFLRSSKDKFYNYVVKEVLQKSKHLLNNAKIRIDGSGDRLFKQNIVCYIRKMLNSKNKQTIKNFKFCDSKSNVLIQLADMIAGTIKRSYDKTKTDSKEYKKEISKQIDDIWEFH